MLADTCKGCNTVPLMRDKQRKEHCLLCGEPPGSASPPLDEFIAINEKGQDKTKPDDDGGEKKKKKETKKKHRKKTDKRNKHEENREKDLGEEEKASPKNEECCRHHQKARYFEIDPRPRPRPQPQPKTQMKQLSRQASFTIPLDVIKSLAHNILKLDLNVQSPTLLLTTLDILDEQLGTFELLRQTENTQSSSAASKSKHVDDGLLEDCTSAPDISAVTSFLYSRLRKKLDKSLDLAATMKITDLDSAALQRSLFETLILLSQTLSRA